MILKKCLFQCLFVLGVVVSVTATASQEVSALDANLECHTRKFTKLEHPGGRNRFTFECKSLDNCTEYCLAEAPEGTYVRDARLIEQTSEAECVEGVSWGYQGGRWVWTDHGCQGVFEAFTY